jgi:hypothetical protein
MKTLLKKRWGMGLFDFKKKKEAVPLPPQPAEPAQPAQPTEPREEIDFDKLMSFVPQMPSEPLLPPMPVEGLPRSGRPLQPMNKPPQAVQTKNSAQSQGDLAKASEPGFELPDFEEEEREEIPAVIFEKPKPLMKPVTVTEPIKIEEEVQKPAPEMPIAEGLMSYPEKPAMKPRQESFVDIQTYMTLKEDMDGIKKLATATDNLIEQHATTINATNDKYHELADSLNFLQEKIILIDTKLFETP